MSPGALTQIKVFNHEEIYYSYIRGRALIYLDQNVWIDFEEGRHPDALILLKMLKQRGRIICPLSFALVEELFDQPTQELRQRRAKLMDELSGGAIVRDSRVRERNEVMSIFESSDRANYVKEQGYSVAGEFLGDMVVTPANRSLLALKVAEFCAQHSKTSEELRSVLWFVNHVDLEAFRKRHIEQLEDYVSKCQADLVETREDLKKFAKVQRKDRALHKMRLKQLASYSQYLRTKDENDLHLRPGARPQALGDFRIPLHHCKDRKKVMDLINEPDEVDGLPNRKLLSAFFHEIPTVELRHQYYASTYLGTRRPKTQDLYDVEHITTIPYVDYFVSSDGYLNDVLRGTTIPQRYGCQLVDGISNLIGFLGSLLK